MNQQRDTINSRATNSKEALIQASIELRRQQAGQIEDRRAAALSQASPEWRAEFCKPLDWHSRCKPQSKPPSPPAYVTMSGKLFTNAKMFPVTWGREKKQSASAIISADGKRFEIRAWFESASRVLSKYKSDDSVTIGGHFSPDGSFSLSDISRVCK